MRVSALAAGACLAVSVSAHAALPTDLLTGGGGVNVHFLDGHAADLARIHEMGFRVVRTDLRWSAVETGPGIYDWSHVDRFMAELDQAGLRALLILDSSNRNYEPEVEVTEPGGERHRVITSPVQPSSLDAFARFAAMAAKRYAAAAPIFEIWNEPDWTAWRPRPDPDAYGRLQAATCHAIRAAVPGATVIGPALSQVPSQVPGAERYIQQMLAAGDFDCVDGFSIHPYRKTDPSTVTTDTQALRPLLQRASRNDHLAKAPILYGEWGWSTWTKGESPERQGVLAVKMLLTAIHEHVPLAIWYDWQDDGTDKSDKEQNFGLIDAAGAAKPAAHAVADLFTRLTGAVYEGDASEGAQDRSLIFRRPDGRRFTASWNASALDTPPVFAERGK